MFLLHALHGWFSSWCGLGVFLLVGGHMLSVSGTTGANMLRHQAKYFKREHYLHNPSYLKQHEWDVLPNNPTCLGMGVRRGTYRMTWWHPWMIFMAADTAYHGRIRSWKLAYWDECFYGAVKKLASYSEISHSYYFKELGLCSCNHNGSIWDANIWYWL